MKRRILIIGIDGGTWRILQPAMEQGYMPHLKSLVDSGASGILESTIPAITPAAWSSFQTGMNPGETGVMDFYRWDKKQRQGTIVNSNSLPQTIWEYAGKAGKRVGVLNVPMTFPPRGINGYMITGLLTPGLGSQFTYPAELKDDLLQAVPGYGILTLAKALSESPDSQIKGFIRKMRDNLDRRTEAAGFLIKKEPLDMLMVHFQAPDVVQHGMWGYMDEEHPLYDAAKHKYILKHFYGRLDENIGCVCRSFTESGTGDQITYVISDHGFQSHQKVFRLGVWLRRQGYLKLNPRSTNTPLPKKITKKLGVGKLLGRFMAKERLSRIEASFHLDTEPIAWSQSKAFAKAGNCEGFIYLLEENERQRQATADEITEKLSGIKDPETGAPVVAAVHPKEKIYQGRYMELMPDLIVEPTDGYSFLGKYQPTEELFHTINIDQDAHIGKHHKDGILVVTGNGIAQRKDIKANITDLAPSILYCLGAPYREDSDGKIIEDIFTESFDHKSDIAQTTTPENAKNEEKEEKGIYTRQDEKEIENRLRDLGYL